MDRLPGLMQDHVRAYLRADNTLPLSKLLAYKIDVWFSTNPYSKTLSLLYLTLALVYLGGLGIYAVSGESVYDAFWQVLFSHKFA